MKIVLIVTSWKDSRHEDTRRDDLANGLFEPGQTFSGNIHLEVEDEKALRQAIADGYYPEFVINRP